MRTSKHEGLCFVPCAGSLVPAWLMAFVAMTGGAMAENIAGGATTVMDESRNAFTLPASNLAAHRRGSFFTGNSFFNQNWVAAPASTAARDGLGPLFNARSCSACHF